MEELHADAGKRYSTVPPIVADACGTLGEGIAALASGLGKMP
jgi:hypothetical protein